MTASRRASSQRAHVERLRIRCPAKVNLGLWVLGRRPDGYHEIDTILQAIALEDEISIEAGPPGLLLETSGRAIRGENIIERAWTLLAETGRVPRDAGVRAKLRKRIPVGAGLGGGSSDAAGFLVGVDRLFGLALEPGELQAISAKLGSDIPFFLRGGIARATGRGERVRHLCPMNPFWIVLASPADMISTTWAYRQLRNRLTHMWHGASILESTIERNDLGGVARAMHNEFECVILPQLPEVAELQQALVSAGAMNAQLSGSGSSVFAIAHSRVAALAVAEAARGCRAEIRVVRTIDRGVFVSPL